MKMCKKLCALLLVLTLVLGLAGCGDTREYVLIHNGVTYSVDTRAQSISDTNKDYCYTLDGADADNYTLTIYYPNGSEYHWSEKNGVGVGSTTDAWEGSYFTRGEVLRTVLEKTVLVQEKEPLNWVPFLILTAGGIFNLTNPHLAWYAELGWKFKDAEPSALALTMIRLGGAVTMLLAIVVLFL